MIKKNDELKELNEVDVCALDDENIKSVFGGRIEEKVYQGVQKYYVYNDATNKVVMACNDYESALKVDKKINPSSYPEEE